MGNNIKNIVGEKYGRLTVIEDSGERAYGVIKWRCKCECGNECLAMGYQLKNGSIKSCGCYNRDRIQKVGQRNSIEKPRMFKGLDKNNTSGYKGVVWNHVCKRWIARITVDRKLYHLGTYKDIEDAAAMRAKAVEAVKEHRFEEFIAEVKTPKEVTNETVVTGDTTPDK